MNSLTVCSLISNCNTVEVNINYLVFSIETYWLNITSALDRFDNTGINRNKSKYKV